MIYYPVREHRLQDSLFLGHVSPRHQGGSVACYQWLSVGDHCSPVAPSANSRCQRCYGYPCGQQAVVMDSQVYVVQRQSQLQPHIGVWFPLGPLPEYDTGILAQAQDSSMPFPLGRHQCSR